MLKAQARRPIRYLIAISENPLLYNHLLSPKCQVPAARASPYTMFLGLAKVKVM